MREYETQAQRIARRAAEEAAKRDARQAEWAAREPKPRSEVKLARRAASQALNLAAHPMLNRGKPRSKMPDLRIMSEQQLAELTAALLRADKYDWHANARAKQIFPENTKIWLILAGRGFGKTRAAVEEARKVCAKPGARVCMIAKDHKALREVCLEGKSGIIACFPPEEVKKVHKGLGDIKVELVNGSMIIGYTAMEPDAVRGTAFDLIWGDEFAAWPKNRAQDMLDQALMTMRESEHGVRCILSTTPKRIPHVVSMIKKAELEGNPFGITVTKGSSRENTALTEDWFIAMELTYGGTKLGRQELDGELVLDLDNVLWKGEWLEEARWPEDQDLPKLIGVITGVDPSGSSEGDETGIVTVGWTREKQIFVLEDVSRKGAPGERYRAACLSAFDHGAGEIWYESAYGGDNAAFGIEESWKQLQREGLIPEERKCPRCLPSTIKGDKAARAMPVVALYEQQANRPEIRRIWHVQPSPTNGIAKLEDQMVSWETSDEKGKIQKSPNDIDALVHAVRQVMRRTGLEAVASSTANKENKRRVGGGWNPFGGR